MKETKPIYFNAPQQEVMFTAAHTTVFVGGRRLGKTHGIAAPFFLRNVQRMPRSSGAFVVSTYKRGLTNTLPGTLAALDSFGYKRDLHYYIGKKPPKSAGFAKPFIEPAEYEHVISFYNGSIAYIISQDRPGTSNSLTLDYIIGDEAKFLDFEKLKDETFPANGGFKGHFGNRSYHHSMLVLGENYIKQMKRDLPPMVFQTSILCKKVGVLKDGFYNNMRESIHYYTMNDNSYLDSLEYHFDKLKEESCLGDADLDRDQPICIAMDYNSNINWIVAGQQQGRYMRVLKSFYVKYERKLRECIQDFCKYYRHQRNKTVVYYYDTTALNSNYAVNDQDFKTVAIQEFEAHGWSVVDVYIGQPMKHHEKHSLINQGFRGQSGLMPMLNRDNNEELLLAMEQTGTRNTTEGFKKDKSGEKLAETEEDKLEYRTDGTDAFDTLYIGMNNKPTLSSVGFITSAFV